MLFQFACETRQKRAPHAKVIYKYCTPLQIYFIFSFLYLFLFIMSSSHSFHECSLRSSSLLIIHKQTQSIISATDNVFQHLGYKDPHELIGKSVSILNTRHFHSNNNMYLFQCRDHSDKLFHLCVHQDPFNTSSSLEYWLLKPFRGTADDHCPLSVLRLSSYGTVDYAYLSHEFPQAMSELHGHPIMSYIHPSDVLFLCQRLKQCKIYDTFQVRWLNTHPRYGGDDYSWISFTVISATTHDPQTRPICILRPVDNTSRGGLVFSFISAYLGHAFVESIHRAIDQGKTYLMEYFAYIMSSLMTLISHHTAEDITALFSHIHLIKELIDNYIWSTTPISKN